jgi:hypothetical protein
MFNNVVDCMRTISKLISITATATAKTAVILSRVTYRSVTSLPEDVAIGDVAIGDGTIVEMEQSEQRPPYQEMGQ